MNKYQLKMKTPSGLGTEYVYVESYYDNFERFLEEHNIKYKKYDYKTNQDIEIERLNNIINELEKWLNYSIESINEKLNNARDKSGIIYSMNDYQILRLRTFRTKMKEVLDELKELKENKQ